MDFDVNYYDARGSDMGLYLPKLRKEAYRDFFFMGDKLCNKLSEFVQNSTNIESPKLDYNMYKLVISSWQNRQI